MNLDALIPDYVRNFEAYQPSRPDHILQQEYGVPFLNRLNNNENPLGPPPAAARVIAAFSPDRASITQMATPSICVRHLDFAPALLRIASLSVTVRVR